MFYGMLLLLGLAQAGPSKDTVDAAREALLAKDAERALSLLAQARMSIPNEQAVVDAATISHLIYLEGLAPRVLGVERERDVAKWRNALVVYPGLKWDREIIDDNALRGFFEALRSEVGQRSGVPTGVPEVRGLLKAYVDGVEHVHMQAVREGTHVVQVECPDGSVRGDWTDFQDPYDWFSLCPDGVDLSVSTPVVEVDEFAMGDDNPRAGPAPLVWVPPAVAPIRAKREGPILSKQIMWTGAVAGLTVSGLTYVAALVARGKYDDLGGDGLNSPTALAKQRKKTNGLVYASGVVGTVGVGFVCGATLSGEF